MRKMKVLVVMILALMVAFSVSAVFAATPKTTDTTVVKARAVAATDMVNVNTADAAALAKIKGIGPKKAEAIIAYRKANGNFKTLDDLKKVKGIGPKVLEKIKTHLTI